MKERVQRQEQTFQNATELAFGGIAYQVMPMQEMPDEAGGTYESAASIRQKQAYDAASQSNVSGFEFYAGNSMVVSSIVHNVVVQWENGQSVEYDLAADHFVLAQEDETTEAAAQARDALLRQGLQALAEAEDG